MAGFCTRYVRIVSLLCDTPVSSVIVLSASARNFVSVSSCILLTVESPVYLLASKISRYHIQARCVRSKISRCIYMTVSLMADFSYS